MQILFFIFLTLFKVCDAFYSVVPPQHVGIIYSTLPGYSGYKSTIYGPGSFIVTGIFDQLLIMKDKQQTDAFKVAGKDKAGSPIEFDISVQHDIITAQNARDLIIEFKTEKDYEDALIKSLINQISIEFTSNRTYTEIINNLPAFAAFIENGLTEVQIKRKTGIRIISVMVIDYKLSDNIEKSRKDTADINAKIELVDKQRMLEEKDAELRLKKQQNEQMIQYEEALHQKKLKELAAIADAEARIIAAQAMANETEISTQAEHDKSIKLAASNAKLLTNEFITYQSGKTIAKELNNLWRIVSAPSNIFSKLKSKIDNLFNGVNHKVSFEKGDFEELLKKAQDDN